MVGLDRPIRLGHTVGCRVPLFRLAAWPIVIAVLASASPGAGGDPRPRPSTGPSPRPSPRPSIEATPEFLAAIPAESRAAVGAIVAKPTLVARSDEVPFLARVADYDFLTANPDRASLAWRRLEVPCVPIRAVAGGQYLWSDESGNRITWRAVARFTDGVVWLATGQIKPGVVLPSVPVKAVAVLRCPRTPLAGDPGLATFEPSTAVYLQTDSRAASAFLRVAGPAAPRLAEQGAEQLLLFFSGPARFARQNPERAAELFAPAVEAR